MRHAVTLLSAAVTLTLAAGPVSAGIVSTPLLAGTNYLFSVPGVINSTGLGTLFTCTSSSSAPQTVTVEVINNTGVAAGAGSLVVGPQQSVMFGSRIAVGLSVTISTGSPSIVVGSARVLSTDKKLMCSAFVADAANAPINSMVSLSVVASPS
jgi:hypothetical protein